MLLYTLCINTIRYNPPSLGMEPKLNLFLILASFYITYKNTVSSQFLQRIVINETDNIVIKTTPGINRQAGNPSVLRYSVFTFLVVFCLSYSVEFCSTALSQFDKAQ